MEPEIESICHATFQLSLFCVFINRIMFTSNQLSTMRVVYKSVEMAESLQSYIEELAKSVLLDRGNSF